MSKSALVLIGQIAAGKTLAAQAIATREGAQIISIDDVRESGQLPLQTLLDAASGAEASRIVVECSGATNDFELLLLGLDNLGYAVTTVKLSCSIETAYHRLRTTRAGALPRGGAWPLQLRWVEQRLRAVPTDATIETDSLDAGTIAGLVLERWHDRASRRHGDEQLGESRFSFSQLAAFERCPLAYRLRYLDRRSPQYRFHEELVGRFVHAGLAWLYHPTGRNERPTVAELLEWVSAHEAIRIRGIDTTIHMERVRNDAATILRRHYVNAFEIDRRRTLAVEKRFEIDLGGAVSFVGVIDRLAESLAGIPVVFDYKTAISPPRVSANIPDLLQLEAYGIAVLLESRAPVVELRRHYVATTTEDIGILRQRDIPRVRLALTRWIRRVSRTSHFLPNPTKLCGWCTFNPSCPSPYSPMRDAIEVSPAMSPA